MIQQNPLRNRNSRSLEKNNKYDINLISTGNPYEKFITTNLPSNYTALINITNLNDTILLKAENDFTIEIKNNQLVFTYLIHTFEQSLTTQINTAPTTIIKKDKILKVYQNSTLVAQFDFFYKLTNGAITQQHPQLLLFSNPIEFYGDSVNGSAYEDSLFAQDFTQYESDIVFSFLEPYDINQNVQVLYNSTWNPVTNTFDDCNIDIFSQLDNFTLKFDVVNFLSTANIITLNNIVYLGYNLPNNSINGAILPQSEVYRLELSISGKNLKLFINGFEQFTSNILKTGVFNIRITNMDIKKIQILDGVLENDHIPLEIDNIPFLYRKNYEYDHIQYHNSTLYPNYTRKSKIQEIEDVFNPSLTYNYTLKGIDDTYISYIDSDYINSASFTGTEIQISFTDFVNPRYDIQKIGFSSPNESILLQLTNIDPRKDTLFYNAITNPSFVDGFYDISAFNGEILAQGRILTTKYPPFTILSNTNFVNLTQPLEIKSFILVFKEYELTPYRAYLGSSNNSIINGGLNGELIGGLLLLHSF